MPKAKYNKKKTLKGSESVLSTDSIKDILTSLRNTNNITSKTTLSSEELLDDVFSYLDRNPNDCDIQDINYFVEELFVSTSEETAREYDPNDEDEADKPQTKTISSKRPSHPALKESTTKVSFPKENIASTEKKQDTYYMSDNEEDYDILEAELLGENLPAESHQTNLSSTADLGNKINLSTKIRNDITKSEKKGEKRVNMTGKDDRATSEQVLDPRTRLILFRLLSNGFLSEIDGCLSTGKEANVYYGRSGDSHRQYAIKIFKTSILVFKDRDRYVTGNFRFRYGYCKSNPRRMVRTWAEKEMRNLKRLVLANIPCPIPHLLKSHVLIMDFIGNDGWCAPRLKDVSLGSDDLLRCYKSLVVYLRQMYHDCNLVHGDYSEYNILWHDNRPVVIDVSQAVETNHPFASDFLRKDISNVTDFFQKKGLRVLSNYSLFQFITSKSLIGNDVSYCDTKTEMQRVPSASSSGFSSIPSVSQPFDVLMEKFSEVLDSGDIEDPNLPEVNLSANDPFAAEAAVIEAIPDDENEEEEEEGDDEDDAVFMQSYIPTSLHEISNPHQESMRILTGQRGVGYTAAILGMLGDKDDNNGEGNYEDNEDSDSDSDDDSNGSDDSDDESGDESDAGRERKAGDDKYRRCLPPREDADARQLEKEKRKAAKKVSKEKAAEKRKNKLPKHLKKKAVASKKKK